MSNSLFVIIVQSILVLGLAVSIAFLVRAKLALDIEKRVLKFSVFSINEKPLSFFDYLNDFYSNAVENTSKVLEKLKTVKMLAKYYDGYFDKTKIIQSRSIDVISNKFLIGIIAVMVTIISDVLRIQPIGLVQLILAFLVGSLIPDIYIYINYKRKQKQIEDDLLKAVLIMGNAFKSGRSIMQAVEFVSKELDGPIGLEFKKMYIDLTYGLELEVVFERFANRVKLDETKYMASSLVILNKTGGNIVKVFSSIERSFFERRKLENELKSVTALSNFVFKILVFIPFLIFIMIYIFNPMYFNPFISTTLGKLLLIIILLIYTLYIIVVRRVIRIKED